MLAEVTAFPLTSEAAYRRCLLVLEPGTTQTEHLAWDLEGDLLPQPGTSVERLRLLREQSWFGQDASRPEPPMLTNDRVELASLLERLARQHLELRGPHDGLRSDAGMAERAQTWLWLCRYIPSELLVAALSASLGEQPPEGRVQLVSPQLAQILRQPCAETHLHLGAAVSFPQIWTGLVYSLALAVPRQLLRSPEDALPPLGGGERWVGALYGAMVARILFASFLWERELGFKDSFGHFASRRGPLYRDLCRRMKWRGGEDEAFPAIGEVIACLLCAPSESLPLERFQQVYSSLIAGRRPPSSIQGLADLRRADPITDWIPSQDAELHLTTRVLSYLLGAGSTDTELVRVFWQYQRVRSLTYRYLVQAPGVPGLDWFTRIYGRIGPLSAAIDSTLLTCALELESQDLNLAALEVRRGPKSSEGGILSGLRQVAAQACAATSSPGASQPEIGVIFHFIKQRRENKKQAGARSQANGDPRALIHPTRHGRWFHAQLAQADAIIAALQRQPEWLVLLRGIDAASVEQAQPTWVLVPLFQRVRQAGQRAASELGRQRPTWRIPPLRATVHAGEDFTRLAEGIRRMHESVEFGLLKLGDRIGHGVALGVSPERWAHSSGVVPQTIEDRLNDLTWELSLYASDSLGCAASRFPYVHSEISRLSSLMYGESFPRCEELLQLRRELHDPAMLARVGYPGPPTGSGLMSRYLSDGAVYERGQRIIEVSSSEQEVVMLQESQRLLRRELSRMEITVESNPSSNLLIGNHSQIEDVPAFRLAPLPTKARENSPEDSVLMSINADDPVSFASSLADEYAHIYYGLLRMRVPACDALHWIDQARAVGWRSRFTVAVSADREVLSFLAQPRD